MRKLLVAIMLLALVSPAWALESGSGGFVGSGITPGSGFTAGAIIPSLVPRGSGSIWWVDHDTGTNNAACGRTPSVPCAGIQYAHDNKVTANHGDVVMVAASTAVYAENLVLTKNATSYIGYGSFSGKPNDGIVDLTVPTGTALTISATYNYFQSIQFEADGALTSALIDSGHNTYYNCGFSGNFNNDASAVVLSDASSTFLGGYVIGGKNGIEADHFSQFLIRDVTFQQNNSADVITNATQVLAASDSIDHCWFLDSDKASYVDMSNAASGVATLSNSFFSVTTGYLKRSQLGSMTKLSMQGNYPAGDVGSLFVKDFSVTTTAILAASATTWATATGAVQIDQIIAESGATAIAGCTNINVISNNAIGVTGTIAAESAANLSANKNVQMTAASVTALKPFVMEDTKILQDQATGGPCTGGSTIHFTIIGKRLQPYASLN